MGASRAHAFVSGRVQGVGFRAWTRDRAVSLGLVGWVRNLPDGEVEAVFEGEEEALREMMDAIRVGPPGAHVTEVDVSFGCFSGAFDTFRIERDGSMS